MLTANFYPPAHVAAARESFRDLLAEYRAQPGTPAFEQALASQLILALDAWFAARSQNKEGFDGNPMNEVRLLARSISENLGVRVADRRITLTAPVVPYAVGAPVELTLAEVELLAGAYFDAIERSFST